MGLGASPLRRASTAVRALDSRSSRPSRTSFWPSVRAASELDRRCSCARQVPWDGQQRTIATVRLQRLFVDVHGNFGCAGFPPEETVSCEAGPSRSVPDPYSAIVVNYPTPR